MSDEGAQGTDSGDLEARGLHEHVTHWVEVLDLWVQELDRGMGRQGSQSRLQPPVDEIGADP